MLEAKAKRPAVVPLEPDDDAASERGADRTLDAGQAQAFGAGRNVARRQDVEPADDATRPMRGDLQLTPQPGQDEIVASRRRRRTPWWVLLARLVLPLLILAAGFYGYRHMVATRPVSPPAEPREVVFTVDATAVSEQDVRPKLNLFGSTVAGRDLQIRALVAGRVIETGADLKDGAVIKQGDMILRIDPFDYQSALRESEARRAEAVAKRQELMADMTVTRANLKFARDQLKIAQDDLQRAERLAGRGNLAQRSLDERRLTVSQRRQSAVQLENNLKVIEARLRQQDAAMRRYDTEIARNRQRIAETELKAPFDAYVTDVTAQVGRMLSVNDAVATLIDRDAIDAKFTLTDPQFGRLAGGREPLIGRTVEVVWNVGGKPVVYSAAIDRVAARVASSSGGVDVFARIADPTGRIDMRPGAFVSISLDDVLYEDVIRVPASAIYQRQHVFAIVEGRLTKRKVELLGRDGDAFLIKGDLKSGERIMTTRLSKAGEGVAVKER